MSLPSHGHFQRRAWRREGIKAFRNNSHMKSKRIITGPPGSGHGKHDKANPAGCRCGGCATK